MFKQGQTIAVCGFGGIGKTELTRKFIQLKGESDFNSNVIWINAEDSGQMEQTFKDIADYLCLAVHGADPKEIVSFDVVRQTVWDCLNKDKCLIVFDNVERNIRRFLPTYPYKKNINVLITSRYQDLDCPLEKLLLSSWTEEDAKKFIESEVTFMMPLKQEIENIVFLLGSYPLALQQAVALIKKKNLLQPFSLSDFKSLYSEKQRWVLESKLPREHAYPKSIFTTTLITLENIRQDDSGVIAEKVLALITFLNPNDIPCMFLVSVLELDEDVSSDVLEMLTNYSLVHCYRKDGKAVLSIHRLLQEVISINVKDEIKSELLYRCLSLFKDKVDFPLQAIEIWKQALKNRHVLCEFGSSVFRTIKAAQALRYYPATLELLKAIALQWMPIKSHCITMDGLEIEMEIAMTLSHLGKYYEALQKFTSVHDMLLKKFGEQHPSTLTTKRNIASTLSQLYRYSEALEIFKSVHDIEVKELGEQHPRVLTAQHNIAFNLSKLGQCSEALEIFKSVHDMIVKELGEQHPRALTAKHNIANTLSELGQYSEALEIFKSVHDMQVKELGDQHPSTLTTKHNIADTLSKLGQCNKALEIFKSVHDMHVKELGEQHPSTLATKDNIANTLRKLGQCSEALEIFKSVHDMRVKELGEQHPSTLTTKHNMADNLSQLGQYSEALEIFKSVHDIQVKEFGEQHPSALATKHNIANTLSMSGQYSEALEILKSVHDMEVKELGEQHPRVLTAKHNIAYNLSILGQYSEALEIFKSVHDMKVKELGKKHPSTLATKHNIADNLSQLGQYSEALEIFKSVHDIQVKEFGKQHPSTLTTKHNIADTLRKLGQYNEVLEIF